MSVLPPCSSFLSELLGWVTRPYLAREMVASLLLLLHTQLLYVVYPATYVRAGS